MKKIFTYSLLFLFGANIFSAPFTFGYKEDFTIEVKVPDTSSTLVTKAQPMDKNLKATDLTVLMGNGINLGNTLEAYRGWHGNPKKRPQDYEQLWGQPVTNQKIFDAYKEAGFKSVRIPVAWTNMIDYEHGSYIIDKAYLDRVEEIVNYALNNDMYVVINDHWDGQWWGLFGSANKDHRKWAIMMYKAIWTQVAVRFKNYGDKVIFESANEELGGRLNDDTALSKGKRGVLSEFECYDATNKINQCFVDLVRSTGGNNKNRFLLIAGYDTDIDKTISESYKMPEDKAKNRLLISVHYYTPSTYCILSEDASWGKCKNTWGTEQDYRLMKNQLSKMKKFVDAGYGVIIGEYGVAWQKDGKPKENYDLFMKGVVDLSEEYNYCPMLWDCNGFFKKREPMGFISPEAAAIYKE